MHLTDEQIKMLGEHLAEHGIAGCARCGFERLEINPDIITAGVHGADAVVPLIHIQCPECYYVEFYSATLLDVEPQ